MDAHNDKVAPNQLKMIPIVLFAAVATVASIAGGFYAVYRLVTIIGN